MGKMVQERKSGKPTTVLRADTASKAAEQIGESFTRGEPGDTPAIGKGQKKGGAGVINQRRTRRCSYDRQIEKTKKEAGEATTVLRADICKYARGGVREQTLDPEMRAVIRDVKLYNAGVGPPL